LDSKPIIYRIKFLHISTPRSQNLRVVEQIYAQRVKLGLYSLVL